jgi:hypothetical protein
MQKQEPGSQHPCAVQHRHTVCLTDTSEQALLGDPCLVDSSNMSAEASLTGRSGPILILENTPAVNSVTTTLRLRLRREALSPSECTFVPCSPPSASVGAQNRAHSSHAVITQDRSRVY